MWNKQALLAAASLVLGGAHAARLCAVGAGGYQLRLLELRYDGPDPSKAGNQSTIAAAIGASTTPLYECVAQWPESWAGWYEGGDSIIWADCIFTGAAGGPDKTVAFAVDWNQKTFYLSHTFDCSDKRGTEALATGALQLDLDCTTIDGADVCVPKATSSGARPSLAVRTTLRQSLAASVACPEVSTRYQSWRLENWHRQIEMPPASAPPGSPLKSDTGPSFTLVSLADNETFSCAPSGKKGAVFEGVCTSTVASAMVTARFEFDSITNYLTVSQHWACGGSSIDASGVAYMQAACDRGYNTDVFTCTSLPVWIGTKAM